MTIKVGDVVAYCYFGTYCNRRICNKSVTRVMKTFIETDDGSRFSTRDFRLTRLPDGGDVVLRYYYIDPDVCPTGIRRMIVIPPFENSIPRSKT